ncbi:MAG: LytTR family DNA-binding domain-containing protein [Chitinophagaceae bacterium]|jgi:DNA-binding LytR/AlgR family response regulator
MKVLIIEDEKLGAERLQKILLEIDKSIEIAGICPSIKTSVDWIKGNPLPDLVLMDIELSDGQCFEIFNQIKLSTPVIFTTSYDEYALQAFKVNSIDYLLKPIKKTELSQALGKLSQLKNQFTGTDFNVEKLLAQLRQTNNTYRSRFLVKKGQKLITVEVNEIAYFFVEDRLSFFVTWDNQKFIADYTLEEIESMLNPNDFNRINRSFILHQKSIYAIHNYFNGKLKLELKPSTEKEVIVSRESAMDFKIWMGK